MGLGDFSDFFYTYIQRTSVGNGRVVVIIILFYFLVSVPKPLTDGRISCRVIYNVFEITTGSTGNQFSPRARMLTAADALVINTFLAAILLSVHHDV